MKPRISVIALGVDDLERAVAFYRDGLGLPTEGIVGTEFEHGAVAALSHTTDFSVGCHCEDESHYHRSVLRTLLAKRGVKIAG